MKHLAWASGIISFKNTVSWCLPCAWTVECSSPNTKSLAGESHIRSPNAFGGQFEPLWHGRGVKKTGSKTCMDHGKFRRLAVCTCHQGEAYFTGITRRSWSPSHPVTTESPPSLSRSHSRALSRRGRGGEAQLASRLCPCPCRDTVGSLKRAPHTNST